MYSKSTINIIKNLIGKKIHNLINTSNYISNIITSIINIKSSVIIFLKKDNIYFKLD